MARSSIFQEERKREILQILMEKKRINITDMCQEFHISPSTARNDLKELEKNGIIKRTHGGALLQKKTETEIPSTENEQAMLQQKYEISIKALDLINDGDTIAISTGSTGYALAKNLIGKKNLTVVLNDVKTACFLEQNTLFNLFLFGGIIRNNFHYIMNDTHFPSNISINKFFFSCNGFTIQNGATISDYILAKNQRKLLELSQQRILLCDHSKFGLIHFAQILPVNEIDVIITDKGITTNQREEIEQTSCSVLVAD